MDDLVVRQGEHVVLAPRVHQGEGHVVVVEGAMDRVAGEVAERVVHPAHVPLQAEAEAARVGGPGDAGPRRRLLRDHHGAGDPLVDRGVDLLQEGHRFEVLAPAVHVGLPLAGVARVVEVEHRRHGVDAQAVDVELLEPVEGVGHEEVADLAAAEVEDERAPVGLLAARAGRRARTAACRRNGRAPRSPSGSGPGPSRR